MPSNGLSLSRAIWCYRTRSILRHICSNLVHKKSFHEVNFNFPPTRTQILRVPNKDFFWDCPSFFSTSIFLVHYDKFFSTFSISPSSTPALLGGFHLVRTRIGGGCQRYDQFFAYDSTDRLRELRMRVREGDPKKRKICLRT